MKRITDTMLNKVTKQLNNLEKEIALAESYIPEGYMIAADTLSERVKLMVGGLRAFSKERAELLKEIEELNAIIKN